VSAGARGTVELIEARGLARLAGAQHPRTRTAAIAAAERLKNARAIILLDTADLAQARRPFLHWDV